MTLQLEVPKINIPPVAPKVPDRPLSMIIREGRRVIGPELARRILKEAAFDGQRAIDRAQVHAYAELMRRGLWTLADPIAFGLLDGRLYAVNGYHRLLAVIEIDREIEFRIAVNAVESERELRALYYRFDAMVRKRTSAQVLNAVGLAGERGVSKSIAKAMYDAIGVIANGFVVPSGSTIKDSAVAKLRVIDLRLEACEPYWPTARQLEVAIKGAPKDVKPRLLRATTFAVALLTMKCQPEKATAFWRGIAEDDALKKEDVRKVFLRDLQSRDRSKGSAEQGIHAAAIAWNAWYEGRRLKIIKVADDAALRIAGTPVGGRGRT